MHRWLCCDREWFPDEQSITCHSPTCPLLLAIRGQIWDAEWVHLLLTTQMLLLVTSLFTIYLQFSLTLLHHSWNIDKCVHCCDIHTFIQQEIIGSLK